MAGERFVIVNADDFGASTGINRGVIEAHVNGVVTSASLMVTGAARHDAVTLSREHPDLALGLHWDVLGEDERAFDLSDAAAVRDELEAQLAQFEDLVGRPPTHIDSHKHAHLQEKSFPVFTQVARSLGVPLRGDGSVAYVGGFYAQWEWKVTELEHVSVAALEHILLTTTTARWTEIACHPGYWSDDFHSEYHLEREAELRTLTDPAIARTVQESGVRLVSYAEYPSLAGGPRCV